MCHTIRTHCGVFLRDVRHGRRFIVGRKQFTLRGDHLYPLIRGATVPFNVQSSLGGVVISHPGVGNGAQDCTARIEVLEALGETNTHTNDIDVMINGGIHLSPFLGTPCDTFSRDSRELPYPPSIDTVVVPVWFTAGDVMAYDGYDISVSRLMLFDSPGDSDSVVTLLGVEWWDDLERIFNALDR